MSPSEHQQDTWLLQPEVSVKHFPFSEYQLGFLNSQLLHEDPYFPPELQLELVSVFQQEHSNIQPLHHLENRPMLQQQTD